MELLDGQLMGLMQPRLAQQLDAQPIDAKRLDAHKLGAAELKGRVLEMNLADLSNDEVEASQKIKLCSEEGQGRNCITDFHGMELSRDKIRTLIQKWHTLFEEHVDAKATGRFTVRMLRPISGEDKPLHLDGAEQEEPKEVDVIHGNGRRQCPIPNTPSVCCVLAAGHAVYRLNMSEI